MTQDFFEGFEYANVLKYANKVARSMQGMLTDRSLEYEDLVCHGVMAAANAFRKWDAAHNNDRTDRAHLEAFVKTNISGYMKNMFLAAKRANLLVEDKIASDADDDMGDTVADETSSMYAFEEDDSDDIKGKSQRKYAKVFHAGYDEDSVALMDVASAKIANEEDERIVALEAFIATLSGVELDIMNNMLKRTEDNIRDIASRYNVSQGYISHKCANIKDAAREFITNY